MKFQLSEVVNSVFKTNFLAADPELRGDSRNPVTPLTLESKKPHCKPSKKKKKVAYQTVAYRSGSIMPLEDLARA